MPDYSRDPVRREPAALLAHAFAAGRLDRAEYERRLDRLRQDPPDLTRLLWRLPRPAYVTHGDNAFLHAPDRVYARALFGVLEEVPDDPAAPRRRLADRIEAAATAGELRAICAGQVRATHQDRRTALKVLLAAERDGRLDAAEYDRRVRDAEEAKLLDDLRQLHADLPDRTDSRTWVGHLRIGTADRERARDWLGEGLADGRLSEEQYQERVVLLAGAKRYGDLEPVLAGFRITPDTADSDLLPTGADRQAALAHLADALRDGRVSAERHEALERGIQDAQRLADVKGIVGDLDLLATPAEREDTIRLLTAARDDGRLGVAEYAEREQRAAAARTDEELAALLADLRRPSSARAGRREARASGQDRQDTANGLRQALHDGQLDLDEYDVRVRAAHGAHTLADLDALVADLVIPARPSLSTVDVIDRVGAATRWGRVDTLGRRDRPASALVEALLTKRVWRAGMLLLWGVPAAALVALCAVGQGALVLAGAAVPLLMVGVLYTEATVRRETLRREGRIPG
jgi:hypothetical protein